jgi:hypothetical protein
MAKKKSKQGNVLVTFFLTYAKDPDVDLVDFLKNSTDFSGEPKNADGCVIAMSVKQIEVVNKGLPTGIKLIDLDELDQYMHFSFHGTRFCVDRKNMKATCDKIAKFDEMTGEKEAGLWGLNVETSN